MPYITIDKNRNQTGLYSGYVGKNTEGAIEVDCAAPSKYHKLKTDFHEFSDVDQWKVDTTKKQEILGKVIEKINAGTAEAIYNGVEYENVRFYLTAENQRNYAELDRNRNDLTYPVTVWCGDGELQLANADEVHAFYRFGYHHISIKLEEGRAAKAAARIKTTAELIEILNS